MGLSGDARFEQRRLRQERHQIETTLVENAALNQAVLRSLPAHIAVLDKAGTIIAVNDTWSQHLDLHNGATLPEATIGVNYLDLPRARGSLAHGGGCAGRSAGYPDWRAVELLTRIYR